MGMFQFGLRDLFYWAVIVAQGTAIYLLNIELDRARQAAQELVVPAAVNRKGEFDQRDPGWQPPAGRHR